MRGAFTEAALRAAEVELPAFLRARRWFGAKSREIASAEIEDVVQLPEDVTTMTTSDANDVTILTTSHECDMTTMTTSSSTDMTHMPLSADGAAFALAVARVRYAGGGEERWQLLLGARGDAVALDALDDPGAARALLGAIAGGARLAGRSGRVVAERTPALERLDLARLEPRRLAGEQSNSSVVFGREAIVKLFRRLETGRNPDVELTRHLTRAGFAHAPRFLGALEREGERGVETLAIAQSLVAGGEDAWAATLAAFGRALDLSLGAPRAESIGAAAGPIEDARALGRTTGEMHLALASAGDDPAFAPEPVTAADVATWREAAGARLLRLERSLGADAEVWGRLRGALEASFAALDGARDLGRKIRQHGDYHLGQVLRREGGGFTILDFEGEPARPIAERRRKTSPLRDVAGMLRSYGYAAWAALFERAAPGSPEWRRLGPVAMRLERAAREAFVAGHEGALLAGPARLVRGGAPALVPESAGTRARILDVFELDKAIYEVGYEMDHRPEWVRIPMGGIERIIARAAGAA